MIYIGLFVLIVAQGIQSFLERRKFLILVDKLTDKVMSRDYRDYVWGQDMKKEEKPAVHRPRTDADEAAIEKANKAATEATKKVGEVEKKIVKVFETPT